MMKFEVKPNNETRCEQCGADLLTGDTAYLANGEDYCSSNCVEKASVADAREAETVRPRTGRLAVLGKSTLDVHNWEIG